MYYVITRGVFQGKYSGDGLFGFEYLRDIVFERSLDMKKVVPEWLPFFHVDPATKHMVNRCPFGPVIFWMPFYLLGLAFLPILRKLGVAGPKVSAAVYATPSLKAAAPVLAWFAGLGTLAAVVVGYRQTFVLLERRLGKNAARLGATVAVWATPIAWYAVTQPMYQHGIAFGLVALLVERWDAHLGDSRWERFALLGIVGGLAMSVREQEALFVLLPAGEVVVRLVRGRDGAERVRWLLAGVALTLATVIAFLPQLLVWRYYTGHFSPPQVEPLRWGTPMLVVALFSTRAGLFCWSPIAYASFAGVALARRARVLAWALAAVFLVDLYVVSCAWVPSGGYGYGARRLSDSALLLGLGVALLYDRLARRGRSVLVGFASFCVALCLFTMEMQRAHGVPSSAGYARTASRYVEQAHLPAFLGRVFDVTGYPFTQPAGWIFALAHRCSPSAFDGVVGTFQLDRDGQWFTVLPDGKSLLLDYDHRANLVAGLEVERGRKDALVTGPVRLLVSMFGKERVGVKVVGQVPAGVLAVRWNGRALPATRGTDGFSFQAPVEAVNVGVNEVEFELPVGARLARLEFLSYDKWW